MSVLQRIGVSIGIISAALIVLLVVQGTTQKVQTQVDDPGRSATSTAGEPTFESPEEPRFVPGEILVKPRAGVPEQALEALNRQNNARVAERLPGIGVSVIDLPASLPVQAAVRRYESSRDVQYAEPNFRLFPEADPNDPAYNKLYGLNNTGQTIAGRAGTPDADIDAPEAWNTTTGSEATVVAVIDTGVQTGHRDLQDNLWTNLGEIPGNGKDEDGNKLVDDVHGWDFCHGDKSVYDSATDDSHGTHVAGTIAAQGNNAAGIIGVNWNAQIMSLKFLDQSVPSSTNSDCNSTLGAVKAINYAISKGAKISNNSWGGPDDSQTLADAITRADDADQLFVAAAGNDGDDNDVTPQYPSSYLNDNIISVAATDNQDALAGFSNFGAQSVDLGAPGVGIYSTVPEGSYASYNGTSTATPHVSGVAALLKSRNPLYSDEEMKDQILRYAEPKNSLQGKTVTGGRLNAGAALTGLQALDSTGPAISAMKPKPGSKTRDRTPAIGATLTDDRTELQKSSIRFYLDGKERTKFTYNEGTDRLSYTAPRLSYSKHTVKIVAEDGTGNTAVKSWNFTVRR